MKINKMNMICVYPEESRAIEHTTKIAQALEARGFEVTENQAKMGRNSDEYGAYNYTIYKDSKELKISTVHRCNGTAKNVSTEIELIQWGTDSCGLRIGKRLERVKITKDAGERAINNKINKILEKF